MRTLRKALSIGLPILGMLIVLGAVLFLEDLRIQVVLVLLGLVTIEIGMWDFAKSLLPNQRKYWPLRWEVDRFVRLVRRLNAAAVELQETRSPEARRRFEGIRGDMAASVNRMALVAGKTAMRVEEEMEEDVNEPWPVRVAEVAGQA